jgi:polar amino acid transport system substrate-binding protein
MLASPRHFLAAILICSPAFAGEVQPGAAIPPLQAGVAAGSPPFVIQPERGPLSGFTIELFRAIAGRLKRAIVFIAVPPDELARDLESRRFDLLPGPIDATPEAAAHMLFTEGYVSSDYEFGTRAGEPVHSFSELHGKRLAVESGSPYAGWAERNASRYGFAVVPESTVAGVLGALTAHTADATLTGSPIISSAAAHDHAIAASLSLPETRTQGSAAFRKRDSELRDEVEEALRCLKEDGTVARLATVWLGTSPGDEDIEKLSMPGNGVPGLSGFDPKTHKSHC